MPGDHRIPPEKAAVEPVNPVAEQQGRGEEHQAARLAFAEEEGHSDIPSEAYLSPLPYQESVGAQC
jgi:hypothetical protein